MRLTDYNSCDPKKKAKDKINYNEKFAVATITRIRDAIAAIYIKTAQLNCRSQHIITVNATHSTRAMNAQQTNHSKLLSALNYKTQWLYSHSANAALIHSLK